MSDKNVHKDTYGNNREEELASYELHIHSNNLLKIKLYPYYIYTKDNFQTNHSNTNYRKNCLLIIDYNNKIGYGEIGLPPYRKYIYETKIEDIINFSNDLYIYLKDIIYSKSSIN